MMNRSDDTFTTTDEPENTQQTVISAENAELEHPQRVDTVIPARRPRLNRPSFFRELINSAFFIMAALVFSEMSFPRSSIDGPSMQPTLWTGQHLLISRLHYLFGPIQHGDIAVFDPPGQDGDMLIKRVIGVPGDVIEIRDQLVYRNGELLEENYFVNTPCIASLCPDDTWQLGENQYFMMGDNRNRSNDSRRFGPVDRSAIVGKSLFRYYPVTDIGVVH